MRKYGTFFTHADALTHSVHGVIDFDTSTEFIAASREKAEELAKLLNRGTDCRFNCRARRETDYLQGWIDRADGGPCIKAGKLRAKQYIEGTNRKA